MGKQRSVERQCSVDTVPKTFALWQGAYAERHIPTFPVRIDKHPAIRGYNKVGLRGSEQLVLKFIDAPALGFMCGPTSMVSVGDVDIANERFLADFLDRHGATPIIIMTASDKFHAWYRFNGEGRKIKPWKELPFDILGGGFVVAPPYTTERNKSKTERGQCRFIQGSLDDLDRLPVMQNLEPDLYVRPASKRKSPSPMQDMREGDGRNDALFKLIGPVARNIHAAGGTQDALFDVALSHNMESAEPMTVDEVRNLVANVWKMTVEGRNHIGQYGAFMREGEVGSFSCDTDAFYLFAFLRASQGSAPTFWIANGLADALGWQRKRLAGARQHLIERRVVRQIRPGWRGHPAVYGWVGQ